MAPAFGRSISFPLSPARSSSSTTTTTAKKQARHVRSISLPTCRAHPLLAHLHATTRAARAWSATADACTTTSTPSAGLAHLDALHAALAELLLLPEPRAALATAETFSDRLLDGLLSLADAHGAFRETLVDLRRHAAEAQAALRRRDAARLASAVRAQRRADKDLARLASSARAAASRLPHLPLPPVPATVAEIEVSGVLAEALAAAASASAAVFSALEAVSSAAAASATSSKKTAATATLMSLVTRTTTKAAAADEDRELTALEKMEQLDECIADMEAESDKVFRSILHARVALLNIRTQTC